MQLWIHVQWHQIWFWNIMRWIICCKKVNKSFGLWKRSALWVSRYYNTCFEIITHDLSHLFEDYVSTFPSHYLHSFHSYNLNFCWPCTWHLHTFLTNKYSTWLSFHFSCTNTFEIWTSLSPKKNPISNMICSSEII
jgi:hypothetical protein